MSELFARLLARVVTRVRVNRTTRGAPHDPSAWTKSRLWYAPALIAPGNVYLRMARARFTMHASPAAWSRYEVARFQALHGADAAGRLSDTSIWTAHRRGRPLVAIAAEGDARVAFEAAGAETRRAHAVAIDGEPFSHGDLHLANLVYCEEERRASILDFETPHDLGLTTTERHGDDLQSLVLDLVGQLPPERCAPLARAFFDGYGAAPALDEARRRLVIETGLLRRSLQLVRTRLHAPEEIRDVLADAAR